MPLLRPRATPSLAALVLLSGVGPLATDTYLAALPAVAVDLGAPTAATQLTITAFVVGLGLGQLVAGPVSDGRGRRGLVVWGSVAFGAASVACALAPTAAVLVAARLVQGAVAGSGVAVARAVVSDTSEEQAAARTFGTLAAITLLAPVIAPALGGAVLAVAPWRALFWLMAALGAVLVVAAVLGVPETLPPSQRQDGGVAALWPRSRDLLAERAFRAPVLVQCLATAGFFVYIGGSSFVLQERLGLSPSRYALVFAVNAAVMAAGSLVFRLAVVEVGARRLRAVGLGLSAAGAVGLLVAALLARGAGDPPLPVVWVALAVVTSGMGLIIPASTVIAQQVGRRSAGTASSLTGGLTFLAGAATTPLTGVVGDGSVLAMAMMMTAGLVAACAAATVGRRGTPEAAPAARGPDRAGGRARRRRATRVDEPPSAT